MIVRVLGEGQFELDDDALPELERLGEGLDGAVSSGDEAAYGAALDAVLEAVRGRGRKLDPSALLPSQLTVPHEGSTIADLKALLESESDPESVPGGA